MSKLISLTQGKSCIVDDSDYEWLSQWSWHYNSGYAKRACRRNGKLVHIRMHCLIANTPPNFDTDHINRNKLDNRKCNLRVCSRSANQLNRDKPKNNTTGFLGVTFPKSKRKFVAQIKFNGINRHLGYFLSAEEASFAYQEASKKITRTL